MTILAETETYIAEFERLGSMLTIADKETGRAVAMTGKGIAGDFRDCLKTHTPEQVISTYLRIAKSISCEWLHLYKPGALLKRDALDV